MSEEKKIDDVEKFLSEQQVLEGRKQALIDDLLKQREAALVAFDEKLAKLGYHANSGRSKRSHHKRGPSVHADAAMNKTAKPKT
jgi:uncharacterized membrane protein YGL010W